MMTTSPNEMAGQGVYKTVSVRGAPAFPNRPRPDAVAPQQQTLQSLLNVDPVDLRDPFLRKAQKRFDSTHFDQRYAQELQGRSFVDAKVEHIAKHIVNASIKLFFYLEASAPDADQKERVITEVLPDVAMYRTQLANTVTFNMQARLSPIQTDSTDLSEAYAHIQNAVRVSNSFGEKIEHSFPKREWRTAVREEAIPALHIGSLIIGNHFEIEPNVAHLQRLANHLGVSGTS